MGEWVERHRTYIFFALSLVVVTGAFALWARRPQPNPIIISTPAPTTTPTPAVTPTPGPLRVYVSGAVKEPDVYELPPGSIVKDALLAAGGASDDADLDRVNLAVQLYDQQQVYVPRKGEPAPPAPPAGQPLATSPGSTKVDLNSASVEELETLPGIGPAIAQRIVDYRAENGPFATVEDVMQVKGIGPATFAKLEGLITAE
jgi:competence protein ComEA